METLIFKELYLKGKEGLQKCLCTSYSQIEMFEQCAYKWYLTYLQGNRKQITAEALALGSSVHETLEDYFNMEKAGMKVELAEMIDLLDMNIDKHNIPFASKENKNTAINQHHTMIQKIFDGTSRLSEVIKDCEVVACEQDFQLEVKLPFTVIYNNERYTSVYIIGSVDFIVKDKNGDYIVIDYKSGKKVFENKKLKNNLQLPIYSLVVKNLFGKLPIRTVYYFTRLDEIQDVEPLAENEEDCNVVYYKNGNIKSKQRCVKEIYNILINFFSQMYVPEAGKYKAKPTALCSWCQYGMYDENNCKYKMEFLRNDIAIPDGRVYVGK